MVLQHITSFKGDVGEAKKMIAAAAEAGADCVKFQKSCLKVNSWFGYILGNIQISKQSGIKTKKHF